MGFHTNNRSVYRQNPVTRPALEKILVTRLLSMALIIVSCKKRHRSTSTQPVDHTTLGRPASARLADAGGRKHPADRKRVRATDGTAEHNYISAAGCPRDRDAVFFPEPRRNVRFSGRGPERSCTAGHFGRRTLTVRKSSEIRIRAKRRRRRERAVNYL